MKFRKKPVFIEAVRVSDALTAAVGAWGDLPPWLRAAHKTGGIVFGPDGMFIQTLEGNMWAYQTDWLIQGIQGELYPCKPDIFEATYEPVSDDA